MGLSQSAKKHGNKLVPVTESFGASLGIGCISIFKELSFIKRCRIFTKMLLNLFIRVSLSKVLVFLSQKNFNLILGALLSL
jgi:hypothetical protein